MDKYKEMSPETVLAGVRDLEQEKKRTRETNVLLKPSEHVKKEFPTCPVCGSKDHVSWSRRLAGFVCTECSLAHTTDATKYPFDGKFWVKSQDGSLVKMYSKEGNVYEVDETNTKVLRIVPVAEHDWLHECSICHTVGANNTKYVGGLYLCKNCTNALGDIIDDWEDTRESMIIGSEDYPF